MVGRKGVGRFSMWRCVTELPGELGIRQGYVGETETLGISLLMGMMSGSHPSCFVPESWLNLLLVPQEGPSAVTKPVSVRRRCWMPPPHGRASPGGAEQPPGEGGREGWLCRAPSTTFLTVQQDKKSTSKPGFGFITYLSERDNVFNLV